jgi:hypothetical protein
MLPIVRVLLWRFGAAASKELMNGLWPAVRYAKRAGVGILFIIGSVIAWLSTMFFLLLGLFFYLSQIDQYITPALWTGGLSLILGVILVFFGMSFLRRPRF